MKYLLITLEYPPFHGGVADYYGNLVKHAHGAIEILTNQSGQLINKQWPFLRWLPGIHHIAKELTDKKINYCLVGHILPIGTMVWLLSHVMTINYAVFLHGLDLSSATAKPRKLWLTKLILNKADKIICANSRTAAEARGLILPMTADKITVVNPGIDLHPRLYQEDAIKDLRRQYKLQDKTVFLTVGRLVRRKAVDLVLQALAKTNRQDWAYVIIGQGREERHIKDLLDRLNLKNQVVLLTEADDDSKEQWLQLADVFVMASRDEAGDYEGFGIVYLEAGLAGKPVIGSRGGGVADAIIDNETGLLVEPNNVDDLAEAMLKLAEYEGLRQRLGDNGRQRAITEFNWAGQAKKALAALR